MVIARSVLKDHLRSKRARQAAPLAAVDLERITAEPDRRNLGPDPELERALGELSPRDRELIALRFGGDLVASEIASLCGLSVANVQQIMSRSLRKLRAALDGAPAAERRVGVG
jgi:RNA polymerase sigma-70 factor (ECF subfamily)